MSWFKGTGGDFEKELKKKNQQEEREKKHKQAKEKQKMEERNRRFEWIVEEMILGGIGESSKSVHVIKDKKTGVCYLLATEGSGGISGLTILVDKDGKPVIDG